MKDIAEMIVNIYRVGPLTHPEVFQCSELKAEVPKMLEKCEVKIQCATIKYKHMHTAFVMALNKLLTENLFKVQDVQEFNDPE